jgi:hypothetical protein
MTAKHIATSCARGGRHKSRPRCRETGAIGVMFAGGIIVLFGFFALALDLSQLYNRKMELQNAADTVALAAAPELDGTATGITNALQRGSEPFSAAINGLTFQYGHQAMTWNEEAIEFGASPSGPWLSAAAAKGAPSGLLYVKVDTAGLDATYGAVTTLFVRVVGNPAVTSTTTRAIAGRSAIKVTPLGICAMGDDAHRKHNTELEEFGFRRGVSYNLLDLNRTTSATGATFIVNPLPGTTPITSSATLAPFVCSGTMAMLRLTGGKVRVSSAFPIGDLFNQFNSRFGANTYCDARSAPADVNVKEYLYNTGAAWMKDTPQQQSALALESDGKRWTVAGPDTAPSGTTAAQYGPLWSYAKAVPYAAYEQAGSPEPAGGYATFAVADWATLYNPGQPATSTTTAYPAGAAKPTPYLQTAGAEFYKSPGSTVKSAAQRRVLNLPLLACPVTGSQATVLGVGKFFMTVMATKGSLYGEFAGLVSDQALGTRVVLYP